MSERPHVYVSRIAPTDPLPSPASYQPRTTVEIRVYFPPNASHQAEDELESACRDALDKLHQWMEDHDVPYRN